VAIIRVGQSDARRVDQEAQLIGLRWRSLGRPTVVRPNSSSASSAERIASSGGPSGRRTRAFIAGADEAYGFYHNRLAEMAEQRDPLSDRNSPAPLRSRTNSRPALAEHYFLSGGEATTPLCARPSRHPRGPRLPPTGVTLITGFISQTAPPVLDAALRLAAHAAHCDPTRSPPADGGRFV
jgi:hypothetical protein